METFLRLLNFKNFFGSDLLSFVVLILFYNWNVRLKNYFKKKISE